jgi:hypothetical protein
MKVRLIRNWFDEITRQHIPAGTDVEVTANGGTADPTKRPADEPPQMPKAKYELYLKIERESGPEFIPYFAGTEETKVWLAAREKRFEAVKAENARRANVQAKKPS